MLLPPVVLHHDLLVAPLLGLLIPSHSRVKVTALEFIDAERYLTESGPCRSGWYDLPRRTSSERKSKLAECAGRLDGLHFPSLQRPAVPSGAPPTPELIAWAVRVYVFSALSQARALLRSFVLLAREGHIPASFLIARGLFNLAGQMAVAHVKVPRSDEASDLQGAWGVLYRLNMGNRHMHDHGERRSGDLEWLAPVNVMEGVRGLDKAFEALGMGRRPKAAEKLYSALSEHSHPNMGALVQHLQFVYGSRRRDGRPIPPGRPRRCPTASPRN